METFTGCLTCAESANALMNRRAALARGEPGILHKYTLAFIGEVWEKRARL